VVAAALDCDGLRRCRPVFVPAAYLLTTIAFLSRDLRPVLARTGSVAMGVPTATVDASQSRSSELPASSMPPVASFMSEFGQLDRG
jgi:hypothetical protein